MRRWAQLALIALISCRLSAAIEPTLKKTPAYFYDLYGKPKEERRESYHDFELHEKVATARVKGPFLKRLYVKGDLRIEVVYSLPALEAIWVRYTLLSGWTDEKVSAALARYSDNWTTHFTGLKYLISNTGHTARVLTPWLNINSAGLTAALRKQNLADEAARKAVPKF